MSFLRWLINAGTTRAIRKILPCINAHADEVYDFFLARPHQWVVFIGAPSELDVNRLPKMDEWFLGREPMVLPSFRVPKLHDALVTVCCISKEGMMDLVTLSSQLDARRVRVQQELEYGTDGQQPPPRSSGAAAPRS